MTDSDILSGNLVNLVTDDEGLIRNHRILATRQPDGAQYAALIDKDGNFEFHPLPVGTYEVTGNKADGLWAGKTQKLDVHSTILKRDLDTYQNWQMRWNTARQEASHASVTFRTARDHARIASGMEGLERSVHVIDLGRDSERPSGMRFGALVHATLAAVPLNADDAQVREITSLHARILESDEQESTASRCCCSICTGSSVHGACARCSVKRKMPSRDTHYLQD